MTPQPITAALIENQRPYRTGLAHEFKRDTRVELVVEADSVEDFLAQSAVRPDVGIDVLILDYCLRHPGLSGIEAVRFLSNHGRRVLVLSVESREAFVLDAISAGALGYLSKNDASVDEIVQAVMAVAAGRTYYSPTLAGYVLRGRRRLSRRQREILRLVARGYTDQEIASELFITVDGVHSLLDALAPKIGSRRRGRMANWIHEHGYDDADDA